jgi:hypothetical protein
MAPKAIGSYQRDKGPLLDKEIAKMAVFFFRPIAIVNIFRLA